MNNLDRLYFELGNKNYFGAQESQNVYESILLENNLDPYEEYEKANDQINMLESVYTLLNMLANNLEAYVKVETEFVTTSAAYQYLEKRLKDLRAEIDRIKIDTHYEDQDGNTSGMISYMFYNGRCSE